MVVFEFTEGALDGLVAEMDNLPLGAILRVPAGVSAGLVSHEVSDEPFAGGDPVTYEYLHTGVGEMTFVGYV